LTEKLSAILTKDLGLIDRC